ncbi:MAG TPA: sialidase family protein [Thermoanaerobaculia bacterium]|nr:sialidase family protein [Thermoanaerobaculia bacterium]
MHKHKQRTTPFILGLGALLVSGAALAAGPKVSRNVQVNDPQELFPDGLQTRNTTTLAVSEDMKNLLGGWDDFEGFCGLVRECPPPAEPGISGYGFSTDGGKTWTDGGTPPPIGTAFTAGHPWVDRGGQGGRRDDEVFYFVSRMQAGPSFATSAGLGVHRGHFGAGTFVWDDAQLLAPSNPEEFYSRQAIAAAKDRSGAAYIVQSNITPLCGIVNFGLGQIEVFRTHDAGDTWQGPVVVSPDAADITDPNNPDCGLTGSQQVAPAPAIGHRGELYLVWQHGPTFDIEGNASNTSRIAFARSLNGGFSFSTPQFLTNINNMRENPPVGYGKNRMNDQPRIAAATRGNKRGRVYVTFYQAEQPVSSAATAQSAVSSDIYITWSDNKGVTWSTPKRITTPVPPTGVKRFWPTVAVQPGGEVVVVYMESKEVQVTPDPADVECSVLIGGGLRREGPLSSLVDTYWIESRDGGATFGAPVRVSKETSNWCEADYAGVNPLYSSHGDYLGVATGWHRTFMLWPDNRNGVVDVFFSEVKSKN